MAVNSVLRYWLMLITGICAVSLCTGCAPRITNLTDQSRTAHSIILADLREAGLDDDYIKRVFYTEHTFGQKQWVHLSASYELPAQVDWHETVGSIGRLLPDEYTMQIHSTSNGEPRSEAAIVISKDELPVARIDIAQVVNGRIAIVIDDVGYNKKALHTALSIKRPVTYAVLPHLAYSQRLAATLSDAGYLIILHQPMEATKNLDTGPGAIMMDMTEQQIRETLEANLQSIPQARGVNNHMGSAVTADATLVRVILGQVNRSGLFFLDSVTGQTVCSTVAAEMGIPIYTRDVFLDNTHEKQYIDGQLNQLIDVAFNRGWAVGIGHFHPVTMETIHDKLDDFDRQGIKLVYLNELPR